MEKCQWDTAGVPVAISCIFPLFKNIINSALLLSGTVAVLFVIYAGYLYIRSGGDAKQLQTAQQTLTYAIIGLLLVLFSFTIVYFLSTILGVDCIQMFGFDNCKM